MKKPTSFKQLISNNGITKTKIATIIASILFMVIIIALSRLRVIPFFGENQTLYFSSTLAQVSATLFGLVITSYVFLDGKLTKDVENDNTLLDVVKELKFSYRHILLVGGILTGISLLLCIGNIIIGDYSKFSTQDKSYEVLAILLNGSYSFSMASIFCSLYFTYKATDPKRIKKASQKAIKEIPYTNKSSSLKMEENYLANFMKNYNQFEQFINSFVNAEKYNETKFCSPIQNFNYLKTTGIIDNDLLDRIQEMRRFRNFLVHGADMFVNKETFDALQNLIKEIEEKLETYENNQ